MKKIGMICFVIFFFMLAIPVRLYMLCSCAHHLITTFYDLLVSRSQTHPTASEGKGLVDYYRASRSSALPRFLEKALDKCVTNVST